ncbi:deoxyribose-phosphate aldolase [Veronia nyctiphanis]|uniref:Deoxyribose-phosphate aldolase n=1 Tax=Veronia nyctiphanis TaxID=1278244 RepID=A0A4V1LT36_9GAMM|nr:deoxyribose-phosphate aldolase [Veronia nyctiphanis]RXJ73828.1 deoxyribose-phosphate aldolase [Veronia nyctiphanis]
MSDRKDVASKALMLMDLTTLNDDDTPEKVTALCESAKSVLGNTAAVCIYPMFIPLAKAQLRAQGTPDVMVATVVNFPQGGEDIDRVVAETQSAILAGADEVDVVFPYRALMAGDERIGFELIRKCKAVCGDKVLKVIIESGELKTPKLIAKASKIAINAGADFIKTSTGKVAINATPQAAEIMLGVIKELGVEKRVGFKAAGGVRSLSDANIYLELATKIIGPEWADKAHFRFGASGLLNDLLAVLDHDLVTPHSANESHY